MQYNGWTNKETWLVNLWLGDLLADWESEGLPVTFDAIRDLVEEITSEVKAEGFVSDLLNSALGEINYHEIASHYQTETQTDEVE